MVVCFIKKNFGFNFAVRRFELRVVLNCFFNLSIPKSPLFRCRKRQEAVLKQLKFAHLVGTACVSGLCNRYFSTILIIYARQPAHAGCSDIKRNSYIHSVTALSRWTKVLPDLEFILTFEFRILTLI
jgi:hypothetical protein